MSCIGILYYQVQMNAALLLYTCMCVAAAHRHSLTACKVQSFRITGRAQFPIGTVHGYMHMKYGYTEFVFGVWTDCDSENQLSD